MAYKQASTILMILLLAIVATNALSSYDALSRRRAYNNQEFQRLMFNRRTVSCPSPYIVFGDDDCVCSFLVDLTQNERSLTGGASDGFNSVNGDGNCGMYCPDGFTFVSASYINGPFTFAYGDDGITIGGRVCKPNGK